MTLAADGAAVVELGTDWEPRVAAPAPVSVRRRRLLTAGVAAALVAASALAGSVPYRPAFTLVATAPGTISGGSVLLGERLYMMGRGGVRIDAYALPSGRHLWYAAMPMQVDSMRLAAGGEVLLVNTYGLSQARGQVSALDAGTGRVLWREDNARLADAPTADAGGLLLPGTQLVPTVYDAGALRLVDARTGAHRWSHPVSPGTSVTPVDQGRLVLRAPYGTASVLDAATGRTLATGELAARDPRLSAIGDRVFVFSSVPDGVEVDAYDATTLRPRWQFIDPYLPYGVLDCGRLLCLVETAASTALDPGTGAVRWHADHWTAAGLVPGGLLAADMTAPRGGLGLLDPATGRVRVDLGEWAPVEGSVGGARTLVTRAQVGRSGVWVGTLEPDRAQVRVRGWLPGAVNSQCQFDDAGYLACTTRSGAVRVWRYRAGG